MLCSAYDCLHCQDGECIYYPNMEYIEYNGKMHVECTNYNEVDEEEREQRELAIIGKESVA